MSTRKTVKLVVPPSERQGMGMEQSTEDTNPAEEQRQKDAGEETQDENPTTTEDANATPPESKGDEAMVEAESIAKSLEGSPEVMQALYELLKDVYEGGQEQDDTQGPPSPSSDKEFNTEGME